MRTQEILILYHCTVVQSIEKKWNFHTFFFEVGKFLGKVNPLCLEGGGKTGVNTISLHFWMIQTMLKSSFLKVGNAVGPPSRKIPFFKWVAHVILVSAPVPILPFSLGLLWV